jgi:two-component system sensor histidine kinase ChvG
VIAPFRAFVRKHWPRLRLRTIVFGVLLFAAAMPGLGAIFLRVYENTLVRQTEAELVAQGAALAAAASVAWPGPHPSPRSRAAHGYQPEVTSIDLSRTLVLPERPPPAVTNRPAEPDAVAAAARLAPVVDLTTRTTLASVVVTDADGVVVGGERLGGDLSGLPEVQAALAGRPATVLRRNGAYRPHYALEWLSRASDLRLHHARPILVNGRVAGVLLLSRSPRALFRGLYEDRGKIALGVVAIFGVIVVMAGLVSRGVTRPIEALSAAARDVAAGLGAVPQTPQTAAIEIQALYDDFRIMAERIERRSGYLRDFAAAVSHEFKTPLSGIRGAVELLDDHHDTMSLEERKHFLGNIASDTQRLSTLVTRLLDLARADLSEAGSGAVTELEALLRTCCGAWSGLAVDLALEPRLPPVAIAEQTLESVLTILLQNSLQAGARTVRVAARRTAGSVAIEVCDDGPGVAPGDRERLFEPFFTSRRAEGGTGLGLPIARSLLAAGGSSLRLLPSDHGAHFEIVVAAAPDLHETR